MFYQKPYFNVETAQKGVVETFSPLVEKETIVQAPCFWERNEVIFCHHRDSGTFISWGSAYIAI